MSKSPEERKSAVLQECMRLCPNPKEVAGIEGIPAQLVNRSHKYVEGHPPVWEIHMGWGTLLVYSGSGNIDFAYRLLNLEAKEIGDRYYDLLKLSTQIQEKSDSLEERAKGLVDAVTNLESSEFLLGKCDKFVEDETAVMPYLSIPAVQKLATEALNQWKGQLVGGQQ